MVKKEKEKKRGIKNTPRSSSVW